MPVLICGYKSKVWFVHVQLSVKINTFNSFCILRLNRCRGLKLFERLPQAISLKAHQALFPRRCLILSLQRTDGWLVLLIVLFHPLDVFDQLVLFLPSHTVAVLSGFIGEPRACMPKIPIAA